MKGLLTLRLATKKSQPLFGMSVSFISHELFVCLFAKSQDLGQILFFVSLELCWRCLCACFLHQQGKFKHGRRIEVTRRGVLVASTFGRASSEKAWAPELSPQMLPLGLGGTALAKARQDSRSAQGAHTPTKRWKCCILQISLASPFLLVSPKSRFGRGDLRYPTTIDTGLFVCLSIPFVCLFLCITYTNLKSAHQDIGGTPLFHPMHNLGPLWRRT